MTAKNSTDDWFTPEWVARRLEPVFLDPCWHKDSPVRAKWVFTPDNDALREGQEWPLSEENGITFINPPYSKPTPWCKKAAVIKEYGFPVVLLLKYDTSTKWWRHTSGDGWFRGEFPFRLAYGNPDGTGTSAPFPSVLVTNDLGMVHRFPELRWTMNLRDPMVDPNKTSKRKPKEKGPPPVMEAALKDEEDKPGEN